MQTAAASFALPLIAVPTMNIAQLLKIERVAVTYASGGDFVRGSYHVSAAEQRSSTWAPPADPTLLSPSCYCSSDHRPAPIHFAHRWAELSLDGGGLLIIRDGSANIVKEGLSRDVCSSNITCSALSTDDYSTAVALTTEAEEALDAAGISRSRRRLAYNEGECEPSGPATRAGKASANGKITPPTSDLVVMTFTAKIAPALEEITSRQGLSWDYLTGPKVGEPSTFSWTSRRPPAFSAPSCRRRRGSTTN